MIRVDVVNQVTICTDNELNVVRCVGSDWDYCCGCWFYSDCPLHYSRAEPPLFVLRKYLRKLFRVLFILLLVFVAGCITQNEFKTVNIALSQEARVGQYFNPYDFYGRFRDVAEIRVWKVYETVDFKEFGIYISDEHTLSSDYRLRLDTAGKVISFFQNNYIK